MSRKLKFTVAAILGMSIVTGSLVWMHASWPYSRSDLHPAVACATGARVWSNCRTATQVVHLGTIIVTPTPEQERYAETHISRTRNALRGPLVQDGEVSG